VFIILYGENGDTGKRILTSAKDAFERNQIDVFTVEAEDVGAIKKIRIGHGTCDSLCLLMQLRQLWPWC
jgi:hypothetical protein